VILRVNVVERFDTESISGDDELPSSIIPDCKCEDAIQRAKETGPFKIGFGLLLLV